MRLIGHLADEHTARRFGDFLLVQGIHNQLDHEKEGTWGVWVNDEDKLSDASALLEEFRKQPEDPKYRKQEKAAELRSQAEKERQEYEKRVQGRRHLFRPMTPYGFGPLTFILIVLTLTVYAWSGLGQRTDVLQKLYITEFGNGTWNPSLLEIRNGEIWRLLTPIFVHGGALHIIFNMLWLRDLGSMIEGRQSSLHLLLLVLVIGIGSNLGQTYIGNSPNFGGMSGVVYGLLGYIWVRGKCDPASGLYLHPTTVLMMLVWFFLCLAGVIGHVANAAHGVGLVMGMAWGYVSSLRYR